jgi:UDP-GlcNAc:undecaprenyl-phosphate GlcNAc-1-phosphate transferase
MFFLALASSFILTITATYFVRRYAVRAQVVDIPDSDRKIHSSPKPLLGGLAIYLSFTIALLTLAFFTNSIIGKDITIKAIIGLTLAGAIIMLGGYFDDKYKLSPGKQIIWPILAILVVIISGIGAKAISSPMGGLLHLDIWKIEIIKLGGMPYYFTVAADIFTFLWLLGMMYTTKLLDGLDGLATGIGAVGGLIIFGLTQFTPFYQPSVGMLAIIFAGACLGFLVWNWHPARIFLGEGGSLYLGFILGVLAIISGAKIATALLVMGIPILDVVWVVGRRIFLDKKSIAHADRKHLHYRLLDVGLSQKQAVVLLYFLTATFGVTSLFLRTQGKVIALFILLVVMALVAGGLVWFYHKKNKKEGNI